MSSLLQVTYSIQKYEDKLVSAPFLTLRLSQCSIPIPLYTYILYLFQKRNFVPRKLTQEKDVSCKVLVFGV